MTIPSENFKNQEAISLRKFKLMELIATTEDEQFISTLEEALRLYEIAEYENKMKPMTVEEYNDRINKSIEEAERGEYISLEDYIKEIEAEETQD